MLHPGVAYLPTRIGLNWPKRYLSSTSLTRRWLRRLRYPLRVTLSDDRDLYSGLIRLHILHHACERSIFGLEMIEELARHGYRISPGTLYPILHGLARRGYLKAAVQTVGRSRRTIDRATPSGRAALRAANKKIRELFREVVEGR